jgi:two-component system chemotaxis response regulator CheY
MKRKVLVIEDQRPVREAMGETLEGAGYEVRLIRDGFAAAEAVRAEAFDAITLDLNMPSLDGMTVAEAIRRSPHNAKTPVVVVSAYLSEGVMSELRGKEIARFLSKPFFPNELIAEIRRALGEEPDPGAADS